MDHGQDLHGTDVSYWTEFIEKGRIFLARVAESLSRRGERDDDTDRDREIRAAEVSVRAAQKQLEGIKAELCHKFLQLWQADLVRWRNFLRDLERCDSIASALRHLRLDYAESKPPRIR